MLYHPLGLKVLKYCSILDSLPSLALNLFAIPWLCVLGQLMNTFSLGSEGYTKSSHLGSVYKIKDNGQI